MNPSIESRLLSLFTDNEGYRPSLAQPFEQDGHICATDSHILIRIDKSLITGNYMLMETPNVAKVLIDPNPQFFISRQDIETAISEVGASLSLYSDCPECSGTGEVEYIYRHKHSCEESSISGECPVCEGSCMARNAINKNISIADKTFDGYHLIIICRAMELLDISEMPVTPTQHRGYLFQPAAGIEIYLMPLLKESSISVKISKTDR